MGAEWWEWEVRYEGGKPDVKALLEQHKTSILTKTPDWPTISIADRPDYFCLTQYPETGEQVRAFCKAVGFDEIDQYEDDENIADVLFDAIPRGQGFFRIDQDGKTITFCGYSCD